MALPKITARLEYVTRKKDRRVKKVVEPQSWQDRLDSEADTKTPHEDPLLQAAALMHLGPNSAELQLLREEARLFKEEAQLFKEENARLQRALLNEEINGKKQERLLAVSTIKRLNLELDDMYLRLEKMDGAGD